MNILCLASIVDLQVSLKVSKISSFTFYTRTLKKGRCDNPKVRASNFNRTKLWTEIILEKCLGISVKVLKIEAL